jgi:hypothetical protein
MGRQAYGRSYDPQIRKTEHGSRLYAVWKKMRQAPHCDEWDDFIGFYTWAMQSDYILGAWLRRHDDTLMYCPENVFWHTPGTEDEDATSYEEFIYEWNRTVNRIRKHYGMPPLRGTSYDDI